MLLSSSNLVDPISTTRFSLSTWNCPAHIKHRNPLPRLYQAVKSSKQHQLLSKQPYMHNIVLLFLQLERNMHQQSPQPASLATLCSSSSNKTFNLNVAPLYTLTNTSHYTQFNVVQQHPIRCTYQQPTLLLIKPTKKTFT